jgi:phosphoglycerate dehydrogenase-like enzyme
MKSEAKIVVTSRTFCQVPVLCKELLERFPNTTLNEGGAFFQKVELIEYLKNADGVLLGTETMDKDVIDALPKAKIISKYGVGLDNIDLEYAKQIGKVIGWTGGVNKRSVAEQTLAFMIGMCRNLFWTGNQMKQGIWDKNGGHQLSGKNVGIIGCGHVGEDLLKLLQAFDCELMICDILDKSNIVKKYGGKQVDHNEIFELCDTISLHVPLTSLTYHMVNEERLASMKPSAFIINTSRGKVVDQEALKSALQLNKIAGAAIDVYTEEPPSDLELLALPNLWPTPHIGGNAIEAVEAMGRAAISHLTDYFVRVRAI